MPSHVLLLFALLLCNVTLRTFTNALGLFPKILNVVDLPIVGLIFLIYLGKPRQGTTPPWVGTITRRLFGFCVVLLLGCVLNPKFIYLPATVSQMMMLTAPLLLFVALVNLPLDRDQIISYGVLLRRLIILEVVVGVLQLPIRIQSGDSEAVHGTFPGNAEQYAAFLMIAIFYLVGLAVLNPEKKKRYVLAILLILILNLSIDNKASWLGTICALGLVLWKLGTLRSRLFRTGGLLALLAGVGLLVGYVASKTSNTLYKFDALAQVVRDGKIKNLGKVKAYLDILHSHLAHPHMLLVGAGPSNFYSRASRQFYFLPGARSTMYINPDILQPEEGRARNSGRASDSIGGAISVTTRTPYYDKFYGDKDLIHAVGSIQVDSPFSPYSGLLGETGFLGTWLYLSIYLIVFRRLMAWLPVYREDPNVGPLLITSLGFLVYMMVNSIYGPFLETTRLSTILWSLVALVSIYVYQAENSAIRSDNQVARERERMEYEPGVEAPSL